MQQFCWFSFEGKSIFAMINQGFCEFIQFFVANNPFASSSSDIMQQRQVLTIITMAPGTFEVWRTQSAHIRKMLLRWKRLYYKVKHFQRQKDIGLSNSLQLGGFHNFHQRPTSVQYRNKPRHEHEQRIPFFFFFLQRCNIGIILLCLFYGHRR